LSKSAVSDAKQNVKQQEKVLQKKIKECPEPEETTKP